MAFKTFLKFHHKIDVYQKTTSVNDAGQKTVTYSLATAGAPAIFQSNSSERRVAPYVDNIDEFQFYIPHEYSAYIDYNNRIKNVKDRYGNVLVSYPLEITNIEKKMGFNGKLHHLFVSARKVVENA